ncbi:MAG: SAM-dependent methyltransferase, partial [Planctomycetota bacterium]
HLPAAGEPKLVRHRASAKAPPARRHDTGKPTLLGAEALPWLSGLGLVGADGKPRPHLADKKVQLDRFVEILVHLLRDRFEPRRDAAAPVRVVDAGCGKGHLTFAAWHCLRHVLHLPAQVLGVEVEAGRIEHANALARAVAGDELRFQPGDIGQVPLGGVDVLIALHACNTATDHAIRRGIEAGAAVVVVAPCCHQEVRPQLGAPEPLAAVLQHGLFAERLAEWATDGLRALVLEHCGYRTKVIEFVSSEHTAKNLLLAGVRRDDAPAAAEQARSQAQIAAFRAFFGIDQHALDGLLAAPAPHPATPRTTPG